MCGTRFRRQGQRCYKPSFPRNISAILPIPPFHSQQANSLKIQHASIIFEPLVRYPSPRVLDLCVHLRLPDLEGDGSGGDSVEPAGMPYHTSARTSLTA